jgi:hypothetical protein
MAKDSKNIYQRIAAVMEEVKYVQKTGYNSFHKYKYAKESDYIESLRPAMLKHGLVILPAQMKTSQQGELSTVELTFRIVNVDNPSEFLDVPSAGQGADKGDKGVYKAITGAKKYALSTAFLIETGDDAEADESTDARAAKPATKAAEPEKSVASVAASAEVAAAPAPSESKPKSNSFRRPLANGAAKPLANGSAKNATADLSDDLG